MNLKEEILKLKHGEHLIWPESDYGKAEIWYIHDAYLLYAIPLYGGKPQYMDYFLENYIDTLINTVNSWT